MQTFVRRTEEYLTKKVTHRCVVCGAELLKDRKVMRLHVAKHGLKNLGEYKKEVIAHRQRDRANAFRSILKKPSPAPAPTSRSDPAIDMVRVGRSPLDKEPRWKENVGQTLSKLGVQGLSASRGDRGATAVDITEIGIGDASNKEQDGAISEREKRAPQSGVKSGGDYFICKRCSLRSQSWNEMKNHSLSFHGSTDLARFISIVHSDTDAYGEEQGSKLPSKPEDTPRVRKAKDPPSGDPAPNVKRMKTNPWSLSTRSGIINISEERVGKKERPQIRNRESPAKSPKPFRPQSESASDTQLCTGDTDGRDGTARSGSFFFNITHSMSNNYD